MKNERIVEEAAKGILMFSNMELLKNMLLGFLKSKDEIYNFYEYKTYVQYKDVHLIFIFLEKTNKWQVQVIEGSISVNKKLYENTILQLKNHTKIFIKGVEFIFCYIKRINKGHRSYTELIIDAILSTRARKLTLSNIYDYFTNNYGFPAKDSQTWKNSIRHNLSYHKIFKKEPKLYSFTEGKGMFWTLDLEQADEKIKKYVLGFENSQIDSSNNFYLTNKLKNPQKESQTLATSRNYQKNENEHSENSFRKHNRILKNEKCARTHNRPEFLTRDHTKEYEIKNDEIRNHIRMVRSNSIVAKNKPNENDQNFQQDSEENPTKKVKKTYIKVRKKTNKIWNDPTSHTEKLQIRKERRNPYKDDIYKISRKLEDSMDFIADTENENEEILNFDNQSSDEGFYIFSKKTNENIDTIRVRSSSVGKINNDLSDLNLENPKKYKK